jgi:D-ribose pyranase
VRADGIWHPRLAQLIAALGHGDTLVVADAGLPVPAGVETVDLVWSRGEPPLVPVLRGILAELVVEQATIADEAKDPELVEALERALCDVPLARTSHEALKAGCGTARAVVRTGEDTPYANVVLRAGVPF